MTDSNFVVTNRILSTLLVVTQGRLLPYLETVCLTSGEILNEPQEMVRDVYFPETARLSLLLIMLDQSMTEIISVGNEGILGMSALMGDRSPRFRGLVQLSGTAIRLPVDILQAELRQNADFREILLLYAQVQFSQLSQLTACRSHHDIEQRLARWLLLIHDSTQQDTLPLTQKFIASMLGVRRASITEIAISFQKQGIIQYTRGKITILNPHKLQFMACECYGKIQLEYQRLLEPKLIPFIFSNERLGRRGKVEEVEEG